MIVAHAKIPFWQQCFWQAGATERCLHRAQQEFAAGTVLRPAHPGFVSMTSLSNAGRRSHQNSSGSDPSRYTPFYSYRRDRGGDSPAWVLHCESTSLERVADAVGTPAYVYSQASIKAAYTRLDRAFGSLPHAVCYAVKANSNLAILRLLARLGSSFDIVSGGELDRLGRIGVHGDRIVFPSGEDSPGDSGGVTLPEKEISVSRDPALQCGVGGGTGPSFSRSGAPHRGGWSEALGGDPGQSRHSRGRAQAYLDGPPPSQIRHRLG